MSKQSITELLDKVSAGEKHLLDDIYSQLYDEIKEIASKQISRINTGQTITPTVMANECYIKLVKQNNINLANKQHFLNYLAKSMRLLLIAVARAKSSIKRKHISVQYDYSFIIGEQDVNFEIIEIDQLLNKIERINIKFCQLLEYKLIFNLTFNEIGTIINKSERQVQRRWRQAVSLIMVLYKEEKEDEKQNGDLETGQ
jgi:RNA polymerase sigma factor (TIGR02999 family)